MINWSNKRILVTGGTGHLGAAIVHYLISEKNANPANVRVFYLNGSPADALADLQGLDLQPGNMLNPSEVQQAVKDMEFIFHTAGSTSFDSRQKKMQWQVNVEGTRNLLEAARQSPALQKIVYTSTVNVLALAEPPGSQGSEATCNPYEARVKLHAFTSSADTLQFIEQARANAGNWVNRIDLGYYDSKLAAQELVNYYVQQYQLPVVSILPGTMFGPYDHLLGTGLYLLSLYHNQMPVVTAGGLPLAHVMDVAAGQVLAMEKAASGSRYILSGHEQDNRYLKDMCAIIVEVLRERFPDKTFRAPKVVVPAALALAAAWCSERFALLFNKPMLLSRAAALPGLYAQFYSSARAMHELGYQPKHTFRQAVNDMLNYYITHNLLVPHDRWIDKR